MAFASVSLPASDVHRTKTSVLPRLMSGAALVGGGVAASLWLAVTFGALHGLSMGPAGETGMFGRGKVDALRASLLLPSVPAQTVAPMPSAKEREAKYAALRAKALKEAQIRIAEREIMRAPVSRPLDQAGRAILEQALAASIAERAIAQRWQDAITPEKAQLMADAEREAVAAEAQEMAEAVLADAPPLAQVQGVPGELAASMQAAVSPKPDAAAKTQELAMLPDEVPAPMRRPKADPFSEVMAEQTAAQTAKADVPAPKTIPLKSDPGKTAPKTLMAYARSSDVMDDDDSPSIFRRRASLPGKGSGVAVYDISSATVHMPNGEKLVAHSGRGENRDNPRSVHIKNRGATPPNVYRLSMREALFHGVEALRMTPVGDGKMYGRDGFLTHTYLLRIRGDSSGCVVFDQYPRFLAAYKRGEVKTLIVVPSINELPRYMAQL
ncbi:DUF2778 domain-containing protein [Rhizobium paknamense]|uniref:Tlde1 domain-containing protein n=1 Tax=Rhizobium paknamense TaxID=1206817 RepID=A0ABU0IHZ6_9HYPH|nr:DUF2778 domain-containing protein [Rhizobium paknamense]MDQ0457025.1 hypothetical protein [Rhizobium paknamense]